MAVQTTLPVGDILENGPWAIDLWGEVGNEAEGLLARALTGDGQEAFAKWLTDAAYTGQSEIWEALAQLYRQGFADALRAQDAFGRAMLSASEG